MLGFRVKDQQFFIFGNQIFRISQFKFIDLGFIFLHDVCQVKSGIFIQQSAEYRIQFGKFIINFIKNSFFCFT